jgi:hypothetical protein
MMRSQKVQVLRQIQDAKSMADLKSILIEVVESLPTEIEEDEYDELMNIAGEH